jgi:predicted amino acid-binding ACT domain protein
MEIILGILLFVNIVLFFIYANAAVKIINLGQTVVKDISKITAIVNLNAESQSTGFDMLAKALMDLEFAKRVLEVHSEALQVRSAMGILTENNWPTYRVEKSKNLGE